MLKSLGIDYGEKRIGLAISSDEGNYAFAYQTLEERSQQDIFQKLANICEKENIETIVIGLPLNQEGVAGKEAQIVQRFAKELEEYLKIPVAFEDERFSSAMAHQLYREAGKKTKETRATIDQKSAQLILQTYLDKNNAR